MHKIIFLNAPILLALTLFCQTLSAGTEVANGGDAIVCGTSGSRARSAELFDFYEARSLRKIGTDLGAKSLSVDKKVQLLISRIQQISPLRATLYRTQAAGFFKETLFLKASELVAVPDSNAIALPVGCKLEQLAVQREPMFPQDKRYTINQDLWNELDNDSKAGLILHEIMYREARGFGHTTSTYIRYFNTYIAANIQTALKTQEDIANYFVMINFAVSDFNGINIALLNCDTYQPGAFCPGSSYPYPVDNIFQSGKLKLGALEGFDEPSFSIGWRTISFPFSVSGQVGFYDSERISYLSGAIEIETQLVRGGAEVKFYGNPLQFYDDEDASPKCLILEQDIELPLVTGEVKIFKMDTHIHLNQNGQVLSSWQLQSDTPQACLNN